MSRYQVQLNENTAVICGSDHAIGSFIDIIDKRFAESGKDEQGEGYLVEWASVWGFTQNKIGIQKEDLQNPEVINELVDKFLKKL